MKVSSINTALPSRLAQQLGNFDGSRATQFKQALSRAGSSTPDASAIAAKFGNDNLDNLSQRGRQANIFDLKGVAQQVRSGDTQQTLQQTYDKVGDVFSKAINDATAAGNTELADSLSDLQSQIQGLFAQIESMLGQQGSKGAKGAESKAQPATNGAGQTRAAEQGASSAKSGKGQAEPAVSNAGQAQTQKAGKTDAQQSLKETYDKIGQVFAKAINDAEAAGDTELADFLRNLQSQIQGLFAQIESMLGLQGGKGAEGTKDGGSSVQPVAGGAGQPRAAEQGTSGAKGGNGQAAGGAGQTQPAEQGASSAKGGNGQVQPVAGGAGQAQPQRGQPADAGESLLQTYDKVGEVFSKAINDAKSAGNTELANFLSNLQSQLQGAFAKVEGNLPEEGSAGNARDVLLQTYDMVGQVFSNSINDAKAAGNTALADFLSNLQSQAQGEFAKVENGLR